MLCHRVYTVAQNGQNKILNFVLTNQHLTLSIYFVVYLFKCIDIASVGGVLVEEEKGGEEGQREQTHASCMQSTCGILSSNAYCILCTYK